MSDSLDTQRVLIVLGMHRSGTSALAGVLHFMGVNLGSRLIEAAADNPKGFWEHREIVDVHDEVFHTLGSWYEDIRLLPENWWQLESIAPFTKEISKIIHRDFTNSPIWGVKDPRLCRLLPLWSPVFKEIGCEPSCILIFRNPYEVAASLQKRNGFAINKSLLLWLEHTLEAIAASEYFRRVVISYDQLLKDWPSILSRISDVLEVIFPSALSDNSSVIQNFLDPDMYHNRAPKPGSPNWVRPSNLDENIEKFVKEVFEIILEASLHASSLISPEILSIHSSVKSSVREHKLKSVFYESFSEQGLYIETLREEKIRFEPSTRTERGDDCPSRGDDCPSRE